MHPRIDPRLETPQTAVPTRFAGRCDLRWQPKGATAFTRTFFFTQLQSIARRFAGVLHGRNPPTQGSHGGICGVLVLGCHSAPGSGAQGFTGATRRRLFPLPCFCFLSPNF